MSFKYTKKDDALSLAVHCDLFKTDVREEGLADLPRPDWGGMFAAYSLTSFDAKSGDWVERPYLYLSIPLHGPAGEVWSQTWAIFYFDDHGKLTRQIKRFVDQTNTVRVIWEDWSIGKGVSAKEVLDSANDGEK